MRDGPAGERFPLNTSGIVPDWFVVVLDAGIGLIVVVGTVGLAVQLNPAALFFPVFGAIMIGGLHFMIRGLRNPEENFSELTNDGLRVRVFRPLVWPMTKPFVKDFSYSSLKDVKPSARHGFPWGLPSAWPYIPMNRSDWRHVDVRLRSARFMMPAWGGYPWWYRVLHLDVSEPERFADELSKRIPAASVSEPQHDPRLRT